MSISGLADGKPRLKHAAAFVKKKTQEQTCFECIGSGGGANTASLFRQWENSGGDDTEAQNKRRGLLRTGVGAKPL